MLRIPMLNLDDILDPQWKNICSGFFSSPQFHELDSFLDEQARARKTIFPARQNIFKSLNETPFAKTKVVILGQDPYHGAGQAHGLAFSVPQGVKPPPSLKNIYKELARDFGYSLPQGGDLTNWAQQGVLLLNATLTVEEAKAGSHQKKGWEKLTDDLIQSLNDERENLVFMLWGAYAQKKGAFIDSGRHFVLESVHPSPLSAHRGFIGCGHFSKANYYLKQTNQIEIDWSL